MRRALFLLFCGAAGKSRRNLFDQIKLYDNYAGKKIADESQNTHRQGHHEQIKRECH